MARTTKQGIDYFPLDVNFDDKMELVEARYGLEGFAVVIKLWQKIYSSGYYISWDEEKLLLFKKAVNLEIDLVNSIIKDCLHWQLFDEKRFEDYSILTSRGIQNRYIEATQRRREVEFVEEYLLVEDIEKRYKNDVKITLKKINVNINSINVNINSKNADINLQSKVKESRREESKVKESRTHVFVRPTLAEIETYVKERQSIVDPKKFFDFYEAGNWKDSNGKLVKNWKQKLITWENKEIEQRQIKVVRQESDYERMARVLGG